MLRFRQKLFIIALFSSSFLLATPPSSAQEQTYFGRVSLSQLANDTGSYPRSSSLSRTIDFRLMLNPVPIKSSTPWREDIFLNRRSNFRILSMNSENYNIRSLDYRSPNYSTETESLDIRGEFYFSLPLSIQLSRLTQKKTYSVGSNLEAKNFMSTNLRMRLYLTKNSALSFHIGREKEYAPISKQSYLKGRQSALSYKYIGRTADNQSIVFEFSLLQGQQEYAGKTAKPQKSRMSFAYYPVNQLYFESHISSISGLYDDSDYTAFGIKFGKLFRNKFAVAIGNVWIDQRFRTGNDEQYFFWSATLRI